MVGVIFDAMITKYSRHHFDATITKYRRFLTLFPSNLYISNFFSSKAFFEIIPIM